MFTSGPTFIIKAQADASQFGVLARVKQDKIDGFGCEACANVPKYGVREEATYEDHRFDKSSPEKFDQSRGNLLASFAIIVLVVGDRENPNSTPSALGRALLGKIERRCAPEQQPIAYIVKRASS